MLRGETTTRSCLTPEALTAKLQAHGVERLRGEPSIWVILDGSDLRKPHATAMASLQRVKRLAGGGTVPGYCTVNAIGLGRSGHRLPLGARRDREVGVGSCIDECEPDIVVGFDLVFLCAVQIGHEPDNAGVAIGP